MSGYDEIRQCYICAKLSESFDDIQFSIHKETGAIDGPCWFSDYFTNETRDEWIIDKESRFFRELLQIPIDPNQPLYCLGLSDADGNSMDHLYFQIKLCTDCMSELYKNKILKNQIKNPACLICNQNQHYLNYFDNSNYYRYYIRKIVYITKISINDNYLIVPPIIPALTKNDDSQKNKIICLTVSSNLFNTKDFESRLHLPIEYVQSDILHSAIKNNNIKFRRGFSEILWSDYNYEKVNNIINFKDEKFQDDLDDLRVQTKEWICLECFIKIDPRYQKIYDLLNNISSFQKINIDDFIKIITSYVIPYDYLVNDTM
jgi:hypothetical protein